MIFYSAVFAKQRNSNYKGAGPTKYGAVVPRTIILSEDMLYLAEEDYLRYPPLIVNAHKLPTTPHFTHKASHKLTDVVNLELDVNDPLYIKIAFEEENGKSREVWELITGAEYERKKLTDTLVKKWKENFKLDLTVLFKR